MNIWATGPTTNTQIMVPIPNIPPNKNPINTKHPSVTIRMIPNDFFHLSLQTTATRSFGPVPASDLITMVIPVMATIIPLFRIFVARQLLDNVFWLSLVYVSSYLPMITWLMSNYFSTIPKELEEAAVIDGCGRLTVFMRIFLPISYPIILSAALIIFLNTWNQFQIPLILASSVETKPVAIVVSEFMTKDSIQYGLTAAAGIITVIPPAITALIFRKFLISGMMRGSVKG